MPGSTRRPPVAPRSWTVTTSRSTSLPPVSIDSLHRRRASVSSSAAYGGPVRVTAQRQASPAPASLPTIRHGDWGGHRRASYSSASPNYRTYVSTTANRHSTPDRSTLDHSLLIHNSLSFTPGLKPTCFTNSSPRSFTSSSRTVFTDYCPDRFF